MIKLRWAGQIVFLMSLDEIYVGYIVGTTVTTLHRQSNAILLTKKPSKREIITKYLIGGVSLTLGTSYFSTANL